MCSAYSRDSAAKAAAPADRPGVVLVIAAGRVAGPATNSCGIFRGVDIRGARPCWWDRPQRAEDQKDPVLLHQATYLLQRLRRHVAVIEADQLHLAPVDAAFGVEHGEVGLLRPADLAVHRVGPLYGTVCPILISVSLTPADISSGAWAAHSVANRQRHGTPSDAVRCSSHVLFDMLPPHVVMIILDKTEFYAGADGRLFEPFVSAIGTGYRSSSSSALASLRSSVSNPSVNQP